MQWIKKVLSFCWRGLNFMRNLVMNIVFLFFILLIFSVIGYVQQAANLNKNSAEGMPKEGALYLTLNGDLTDNRTENFAFKRFLKEMVAGNTAPENISTFDVVYALEQAEKDPNIKGVVLNLSDFGHADFPALNYIGRAINDFKRSKKPVIAYAQNYGQKAYLLASYADEVYLNPQGNVDISGLFVENLYFKSLLEKLAITPHIFRVGTYKSAVEPFLRDDMSAEARENMQRWAGLMWQDYVRKVAENRQISQQEVLPNGQDYLRGLRAFGGNSSEYSKARHLVTHFADGFSFKAKLQQMFGKNAQGKANLIDFYDYLDFLPERTEAETKEKIAVVNVEGEIIHGESNGKGVGGNSVVSLLEKAYEDDEIKGVILRVNSPGGSAFASELIRQALQQIQQKGKPVVVSMGGMAASGGYWISSHADYIVADPDTITGSIGIFAILPTFEKALTKMGIHTDGVSTSELGKISFLSGVKPLNAEIIQQGVNYGYEQFLRIVSQGRKIPQADVDKIAQGQVWLGRDALSHHLVDELGDFSQAVGKMRALLEAKGEKSSEMALEWLQEDESKLNQFFKGFNKYGKTLIQQQFLSFVGLAKAYQSGAESVERFASLNDPKGQYLYCLGCGTVN